MGLLPFLDVQRANSSRQRTGRHQLKSSSSYALQSLIVLSISNSWSFLSRVTISWMSFFKHSGAHSLENKKFLRQNAPADTLQDTKNTKTPATPCRIRNKKRKIRSCTKSLFVFEGCHFVCQRVRFRISRLLQGVGGVFTRFCEPSLHPSEKSSQHQSNMQVDNLNLHVALVHGAVVCVMCDVLCCSSAHHNMSS